MTEGEVLDLLEARFLRVTAMGACRYVFSRKVPNRTSQQASRIFDAVVIDTWQSSGLAIHAIEVKVNRSDWLGELKKTHKTQGAIDAGDTFSVVAPTGVVKIEELRSGWGYYEIKNGRVFCRREPRRHTPISRGIDPPLDRHFAVALLRATQKHDRRDEIAKLPAVIEHRRRVAFFRERDQQ